MTKTIITDDRIGGAVGNDGAIKSSNKSSPYYVAPASTEKPPQVSTQTDKVRRYTGTQLPTNIGVSPADKAAADYYASMPKNAPDENAIRAQARAAVQDQIDSINNVYAGLVTNKRVEGQDNLGKTRSINARAGLLGSDFGAANEKKTTELNEEKVKLLESEKALKIADILGKVNKDVQERFRTEKATVDKNNQDYITYLKDLGTRAKTQVDDLAKSGVTLDQLTDEEYNHLIEATGYDERQLKERFVLNKPKNEILDKKIEGNKYIQVTKDPLTGETKTDVIDIGFEVPVGYKTEKLDNGTLMFYPEKFDPNKPFAQQVFSYGGGGAPAVQYTPEQKRSLQSANIPETDTESSKYFLATPKAFQDMWVREGITGSSTAPVNLDAVNAAYTEWTRTEGKSIKPKKTSSSAKRSI